MKTLIAATATLALLAASPAVAMSCCGGGKGKGGMCAKGDMAMNMKGGKKGCCCDKMGGNMSSRRT